MNKIKLLDVCNIKTGKLDSNAAVEGGVYPFFTCAPNPLAIDSYMFDEDAILLAGNNAQGNFHIQRYSGKFNAYQRTYVITAKYGWDIDYIKYSIEISLNHLKRISQGSQTKFLTMTMLDEFYIVNRSKDEQEKLIACLKSIDKKIQLNKKINDNLEQQIQLIFDYLFPDVCAGNKHMGDFIIPKRGKSLLSKNVVHGNVPVIAGGLEPSIYHNVANTIAPVVTISSSGANAGFVNIWGVPVWSSDSSYIDSEMSRYVYFWYAYLKRHQNNIYNIQTGSAQPHIYPSHISSLPITDLDYKKIEKYTEIVNPIFSTITKNYVENQHLQSLRDWLLPMLMNGQATIND